MVRDATRVDARFARGNRLRDLRLKGRGRLSWRPSFVTALSAVWSAARSQRNRPRLGGKPGPFGVPEAAALARKYFGRRCRLGRLPIVLYVPLAVQCPGRSDRWRAAGAACLCRTFGAPENSIKKFDPRGRCLRATRIRSHAGVDMDRRNGGRF